MTWEDRLSACLKSGRETADTSFTAPSAPGGGSVRSLRIVEAGPAREPTFGAEESAVLAMALVMALAGLLLATVWTRLLVDVFGGPAATAPVVGACLAALLVGVVGPGRSAARHPNPLFVHTSLQAAVTVVALALPAALPLVDMFHGGGVNRFAPGPDGLAVWRFLVAFGVFLPGVGLFGASLPVLGGLLLRHRPGLGLRAGSLTASFALGAALGAGLAAFLLLPLLGLRGTTFVAVLLLLAGAVLSLALAPVFRNLPPGSAAARDPFTDADARLRRAALLAVAAAGFTVFVAVVGANRATAPALAMAPAPTLLLLSGFLVAHAAGASLLGRAADRARHPEAWLAALTVAFPVAVLGSLPLAPVVPRVLGPLAPAPGSPLTDLLVLVPVAGIPGLLLGGVFPLAARIVLPGASAPGRWSAVVAAHLGGLLAATTFASILLGEDPLSPVPPMAAAAVGLLAAGALLAALPPARRTGPPRLAVLGLLALLVGLAGPAGRTPVAPDPTVSPEDALLRDLLAGVYLAHPDRVLDLETAGNPARLAGDALLVDALLARVAPGAPDPGLPFTGETLDRIRDGLAPGGVLVLTLHTDHLPTDAVREAVATLLDGFPAVHLWSGSPTALVFVAGQGPLRPDFWRLEQAERLRGPELAAAGLAPEAQVLAQFVTDRDGLVAFAGMVTARATRDGGGLSLRARGNGKPVTPLDFADVRRSPIDVLTGYEHRPEIAREAERYARARYLALRVLRGDPLPAGQDSPAEALDLALALAEEHLCLATWTALTGEDPAPETPAEPHLAGP